MSGDLKLPLYSDKDNKPIWLDSQKLKDRATHCEVPKMPGLGKNLRISGQVVLAILVDQSGNVECIKVLSGHPLLISSAVEAARAWKFKPIKERGKALAFCGILAFHLTTGSSDHAPDPCLCAHW
jgi:TonB family protein